MIQNPINKWYYQLASTDKILEREADSYPKIEYFLTHKHKDDLLFIYDSELETVWTCGDF